MKDRGGNYSHIYVNSGIRYTKDETIKNFAENYFSGTFMAQINKSVILNMHNVIKIDEKKNKVTFSFMIRDKANNNNLLEILGEENISKELLVFKLPKDGVIRKKFINDYENFKQSKEI